MNAGDTAWVMVSAALVLFMTVGLAFFYGGLEPRRNVLSMVAMNLFTIAIVTVSWVAAGFSLAFGPDAGHGLIGNPALRRPGQHEQAVARHAHPQARWPVQDICG